MAHIYLDANCAIQLLQDNNPQLVVKLTDQQVYLSALSVHILAYVNKVKLPNPYYSHFLEHFTYIDLSTAVLTKALKGPTSDLEDNIQLQSAVMEDCDIFVTLDKKLLQLKAIGSLKILSPSEL